jgi:Leucine-rich repeat (LRR) protein
MVNLEKLFLQKTRIDGSGIIYLQNLTKLKVLNLSFTKFDDKAAIDLLKIPSLQEVYLYRTQTSRQVAEALQKNRAGLKIYFQEGPYF